MFSASRKKPFQCPKCAFVQLESAHLISTYCRACGDYYEVSRPGAAPVASGPILGKSERRRPVHCHRCGTDHTAAAKAHSTMCPGCNAVIDLADLEFLGAASRPVDTRGELHIGPHGVLTSSWMVCGQARVEGRISGTLMAEGVVSISSRHPLACKILGPEVVIEKAARTGLNVPLETDRLVVRGHLHAAVRCRGAIHVLRGGVLRGDVNARAVVVERGGVLEGECVVDPAQPADILRQAVEVRSRRTFSPLLPGDPHAQAGFQPAAG